MTMSRSYPVPTLIALLLLLPILPSEAWQCPCYQARPDGLLRAWDNHPTRSRHALLSSTVLHSNNPTTTETERMDDGDNDGSYKFGDITRGILGTLQTRVNSLTGKTRYEFGDLTKWVGSQAKEEIWKMDQSAKERVRLFTNRPDYRFGDITRELIRRLQEGEYSAEDIWLFLRIALLVGRKFMPSVAATLPVAVLMELAELSVAQSVGGDLTAIFTSEVDQRMKQWITGDKDYRLGDWTKKVLTGERYHQVGDLTKKTLAKFSEKDVMEVGGIAGALWKKHRENASKEGEKGSKGKNTSISSSASSDTGISETDMDKMDTDAFKEFEEWDKNFLASQRQQSDTPEQVMSEKTLKEWDECLVEANRNSKDQTLKAWKKQ